MLRVAALVLVVAAAAGCISSSSAKPKTPDGLGCGQRLVGGMWRFTGFFPDQPIDENTRAALERLHGTLRLGFDGQRALTTGPGLYHLGPYQIANDDGMSCRIVAPDDQGIVTTTDVHFLDANHLEVLDRRSAVTGRSTMERVPQLAARPLVRPERLSYPRSAVRRHLAPAETLFSPARELHSCAAGFVRENPPKSCFSFRTVCC